MLRISSETAQHHMRDQGACVCTALVLYRCWTVTVLALKSKSVMRSAGRTAAAGARGARRSDRPPPAGTRTAGAG